MRFQSLYLKTIFNPNVFPLTVKNTVAKARALHKKHGFDTIAFSGISGASMAFILASRLKLPLLNIRKMDENSHYVKQMGTLIEGNTGASKYMIVDDFISSGDTVNHIIATIKREMPFAECVAILMFAAMADGEHTYPEWEKPMKVISSRPDVDVSSTELTPV